MRGEAVFSVDEIRKDFPALARTVDGKPLVYLDNAATSLRPVQVVDALAEFYRTSVGSADRGAHPLARETTARYHEARCAVARLIGAAEDEIIFVRNSTEGVNLVAAALPTLRRGHIVTTLANHHSSLLPWAAHGKARHVGLNKDGTLSITSLKEALTADAALLCMPQVSNAMGLLMPVEYAVEIAKRAGALVLIDGAQSVPHMPVDVKALDCDFLVFSGHKMLAPFGIGVLYGKREHLDAMQPFLLGGGMIESVQANRFTVKPPPGKFEAGTPNVGGAVALATAIDYLEDIGLDRIDNHVTVLARSARSSLRAIDGLTVYGPESDELVGSAVAFGFEGLAAHALALMLANRFGILVRSGYHCAEPFHKAVGIPQTVRASFYLYNTSEEVGLLDHALRHIQATIM